MLYGIKNNPLNLRFYRHLQGDLDKSINDININEQLTAASEGREPVVISRDDLVEVSDNDLPRLPNGKEDKYFRNAWYLDGDQINVDLGKAKEIKKNKMRELRGPLLDKLDEDYQRADEDGDNVKKAEVAAKKKALRDVTKLTLPDDIQELKDYMPDILKPTE